MCRDRAYFGPAGNDNRFYELGNKSTEQAPAYVSGLGLNAFEYQGGHGIRISAVRAQAIGAAAKEHGIALSLHAPYYISLAGLDEEKRMNSLNYVLASAAAAKNMGADRIVVHSGSCGKRPRGEALELAKDTLSHILAAMREKGHSDLFLCIETMGKINQLGTLSEVIELCKLDDTLMPCVDFGHLNARSQGGLKTKDDYLRVIETLLDGLGMKKIKHLHCHFSKIEYTSSGERRHLTLADRKYGPEFPPLAEAFRECGIEPTIICESDGTQSSDALILKNIYENTKNR